MARRSNIGSGGRKVVVPTGTMARKETMREELIRKLLDDPQFEIVKPSGQAYIIVGARRSVGRPK